MVSEKSKASLLGILIPSSEQWGDDRQRGKYPAKIYTIDGVLIYQVDNGSDNTAKSPLGGIIVQWPAASSMATTITNPITHYGWSGVINQDGHSGDLYNYYWTSYSRGVDGSRISLGNNPQWHNAYLDGYIPLRVKSIYDPCPYLYRLPSNGTWNQFTSNTGWTQWSYLGGVSWNMNTLGTSWFSGFGIRYYGTGLFYNSGSYMNYNTSIPYTQGWCYTVSINYIGLVNMREPTDRSSGNPVRCIEAANS